MTVDTKKVTGRREVHYDSFDDLLADAESLVTSGSKSVGNWSLGQILQHLAVSIHASIDGTDMKLPWLMKKAFLLMMNKEKLMHQPMPSGYKIPKQGEAQFKPDDNTSAEQGLAALREAIDRWNSDSPRAEHILFGALTDEEWNAFNLRHAEMHMSFVVPA